MPSIITSSRARDRGGGRAAARRAHHAVLRAVDHDGRRGDRRAAPSVRSPAARIAASWRRGAGRVVAALVAELGGPAQLVLVEREARRADQLEDVDTVDSIAPSRSSAGRRRKIG